MTPVHIDELVIENLAGERLTGPVSMTLTPGTVTLLIGASGSGKSTCGRILAGFAGDVRKYRRLSGTVTSAHGTANLAEDSPHIATMVWQSGALFDDLSVGDNLAIARSHGGFSDDRNLAESVISGISLQQQVTALSGGQRQRLAVARSLYAGADVLVLDEPNAGLDPRASARLAEALNILKADGARAILIIGHHLDALLPLTDQVYMIDGESGECVRLPPDPSVISAAFAGDISAATTPRPQPKPTSEAPKYEPTAPAVKLRPKAWWWFTYFLRYGSLLALTPSALGYALLGAAVVSFVSVWFLFAHLPYKAVLGALLHDQILQGLGYGQSRVLIPLLLSVLMAARNGAVIAADMGHRTYGQQIAAMRNLKIPSFLYFDANILLINTAAFVILAAAGFGIGAYTALQTWQILHPDAPVALFQENFSSLLPNFSAEKWRDSAWIIFKLSASGFATAAIGLFLGRRPKHAVQDINSSVAGAIILSVVAVLVIHTIAAMLEF